MQFGWLFCGYSTVSSNVEQSLEQPKLSQPNPVPNRMCHSVHRHWPRCIARLGVRLRHHERYPSRREDGGHHLRPERRGRPRRGWSSSKTPGTESRARFKGRSESNGRAESGVERTSRIGRPLPLISNRMGDILYSLHFTATNFNRTEGERSETSHERHNSGFQLTQNNVIPMGASRYDVHIGWGGGHGKTDVVREVVWISKYKSDPNADRGGEKMSKIPKILWTSFLESPYIEFLDRNSRPCRVQLESCYVGNWYRTSMAWTQRWSHF